MKLAMNDNEHSRAKNRRTVSAKNPAKSRSRLLYVMKTGLVTVVLFALAYAVETKFVLNLVGAPTPWG